MTSARFSWVFLAALILGGGTAAAILRTAKLHRTATAPKAHCSDKQRPVNSISLFQPVLARDSLASAPTAVAPLEPASDCIREVLPSVLHRVDDWRNYRPDFFTVRPTPESPAITFRCESIKEEGRFTTWIGRTVIAGESFVAVATANGLDAILTTAGETPVEISVRSARVSVSRASAETETSECGTPPNLSKSSMQPNPSGALMAADQVNAAALVHDGSGNYLSGVVVLYDNLALAQANVSAADSNGASLIDSTMKARIEAANIILVNSLVNVRWAYLGCFRCPDHGDTPIQTLWSKVRDASTAVGAFAVQKATETGATQVIVYTKPTDPQWGGYADIPGHFAVLRYGSNSQLIAHELGHNFGLNHDRYTCGALSSTDDNNYSYGMVFAARNTTTNSTEQLGDIMSYSKRLVPYFTNPSITVNPYLAGTAYAPLAHGNIYLGALATFADLSSIYNLPGAAAVQPIGIPADQPYACDGARVFRENAAAIVGSGWGVQPAITSQPVNITVTTGQSFSLNVTATGTGATFTYQWYKDAVVIDRATQANYASASATTADAGAYYVVVTATFATLGGSTTLTSNSAAVTITSAPSVGPTSSSSGGGGGGAINPVFTVALLALLASRARPGAKRRAGKLTAKAKRTS